MVIIKRNVKSYFYIHVHASEIQWLSVLLVFVGLSGIFYTFVYFFTENWIEHTNQNSTTFGVNS